MRRFFAIACLSIFLFATCGGIGHSQQVFVLVAGETADEVLGDGIRNNMEWIHTAFRFGVPEDRLVVRFLHGENLGVESLIASLENCPVKEDDTFVFWWLGRGEFKEGRRMLLLPDGERLGGDKVRDAMLQRMARLNVLVIDAYTRTLPSVELPPKTMSMGRARDVVEPLFQSLFFDPAGTIEIDCAEDGQRPLALTTTGGLMTCALLLPPGVLEDSDGEAGFLTLKTPTGDRDMVLERGVLWRDLGETVEWDTILSHLRSTTSASYRRAMGRKYSGPGQTPSFAETRLRYADHFVEWHPAFAEFRSRPRKTRVQIEDGRAVTYVGDRRIDENVSPSDDFATPNEIFDEPTDLDSADTAIIPGDHVIAINDWPIHTAEDYRNSMHSLRTDPKPVVRLTIVDNQMGKRMHYETKWDGRGDFGIEAWPWRDQLILIEDIVPGSPADRARLLRTEESGLPKSVGLGIRGNFIEFDCPLMDGETRTGVRITEVADPKRSGLKPGDVVFLIEGYTFQDQQGYEWALENARQLAGIWIVDSKSGEVEHRLVHLPHTPPEELQDPPESVGYLSITPADMESAPVW